MSDLSLPILLHSNSPQVSTGYGVQIKMLLDRLIEDGHDVAVSATYGQPSLCGMGTYHTRNGTPVKVYPSWELVSGADVICAHASNHFGGREGVIIPLLDVWSLLNEELKAYTVASWAPVDHDPVPPIVLRHFPATGARCIAMTRHGQREFVKAGIDAAYIPLAVDTNVYKPTPITELGEVAGAEVQAQPFPEGTFVVGMVAMSKDPSDRKGFAEAFTAFAEFHRRHPNAFLYVHSSRTGGPGNGLNLDDVAQGCGVPPEAIRFTNQYAYMHGLPPNLMAAMYTAFDVLLAPSAGEGFCVPMVEAMACGTPVIASRFTAQTELIGPGWGVDGQRIWDPANRSWYHRPNIEQIVDALEQAYAADREALAPQCVEFAKRYDIDYVYDTYWRPYLKTLDPRPPANKPKMDRVAILVPAMKRPHNVKRLVDSWRATDDGTSDLYYVLDEDDSEQIAAVEAAGIAWIPAKRGTSFAAKINAGFDASCQSWIFVTGDDVEFTPGWIEAARELSDRYDVIGTNDSEPGRIRNPAVAQGKHADHWFMRRTYVEDVGGSLEGPGVALPEAYYHWWTDKEVIQLAKARGVFTPCLESIVIHHHPGYDGREDLREADPVYMHAVEFSKMDELAFRKRVGLIEQHRVVKKDIWR